MPLGNLIPCVVVIGIAIVMLAGCSSHRANPELRHRVNLEAPPTQVNRTSIFELAEFEATGSARHGAEPLRDQGSSIFARARGGGAEKRDYSGYHCLLVRMPHSPRLWVIMRTFDLRRSTPYVREDCDSFESWNEAEWYLRFAAEEGRVLVVNTPRGSRSPGS